MVKRLCRQELLLMILPIFVVIGMLIIYPLATNAWGKTMGYLAGAFVYLFLLCCPFAFLTLGTNQITQVYHMQREMEREKKRMFYILAFVPAVAAAPITFLPFIGKISALHLGIALLYALANGTIEELFWRGAYNKVFKEDILFAYIYPSILFSLWHVSLVFARDIVYQGGGITLVLGATCVGFLWGWIAYQTKSIKLVTVAHVLLNFIVFTGFIHQNWGI